MKIKSTIKKKEPLVKKIGRNYIYIYIYISLSQKRNKIEEIEIVLTFFLDRTWKKYMREVERKLYKIYIKNKIKNKGLKEMKC